MVVVRGEEGGGGGVCCVFSHFRLCHFDFVAVTHRLDTCQTSTTTGLGPLGAFSVCGPRTGLPPLAGLCGSAVFALPRGHICPIRVAEPPMLIPSLTKVTRGLCRLKIVILQIIWMLL